MYNKNQEIDQQDEYEDLNDQDDQDDEQQFQDEQNDEEDITKQNQNSYSNGEKMTNTESTKTNKIPSSKYEERKSQKQQIREGLYNDPELEQERKALWKVFGMNNPAGKALYQLYKCQKQPQIQYPKPKQRSKEEEELAKQKVVKNCPQKTQIEYPVIEKSRPQFHMVDAIPRKKREFEIRKEIEKYYQGRKFWRPAILGKDRKKMIQDLQIKFKYLRGALPKGAELPAIDMNQKDVFDDAISKANAIRRTHRKDLYFTGMKPEEQSDAATLQSADPIVELNVLFDAIVREIEERQEFLEEIQPLDEPKLKEKIKAEIIERVSELQKVSELKKHYT